MIAEIKHLPVNWLDGMKINKGHFQQMDNACTDQLRDRTSLYLTGYNYGLIPAGSNQPSLQLHKDNDRVELTTCRAVTRSGVRIEIIDGDYPSLKFPLTRIASEYDISEGAKFFVVLSVNPFSRIPAGEPDPDETPPRQPFTRANCKLDAIPFEQLSTEEFTAYHLPLGKLIYESGLFRLDQQYIPPCTSMESHPALKDYYDTFQQLMGSISDHALEVVRKIALNRRAGEINYLANNIHAVSEKIVFFSAEHFTRYRLMYREAAPIFTLEFFIRLASVIHTAMRCMKELDKEKMLNYFERWSGLKPKELEDSIQEIRQMEYHHIDPSLHLEKIHFFLREMDQLYAKLVQLNYIEAEEEKIIKDVKQREDKQEKRGFFR